MSWEGPHFRAHYLHLESEHHWPTPSMCVNCISFSSLDWPENQKLEHREESRVQKSATPRAGISCALGTLVQCRCSSWSGSWRASDFHFKSFSCWDMSEFLCEFDSCGNGKAIDNSPPGSFVRGILQARIAVWADIPLSRGSSQPRGQTPALQVNSLPCEPPGKPQFPFYWQRNWGWVAVPPLKSRSEKDPVPEASILREGCCCYSVAKSCLTLCDPIDHAWIPASWQRGLHSSVKLWAMLCTATQDGWVTVKGSDSMWSTGEGNGNPLQNSMGIKERQKKKKDSFLPCQLESSSPGGHGQILPPWQDVLRMSSVKSWWLKPGYWGERLQPWRVYTQQRQIKAL